MPQSPHDFARHAAAVAPRMRVALRRGVAEASLVVKKSVTAELAAAGVRDGRLRGVGLKGAKIGVGFDIKGGANPVALVKMRGPAQLIERDTKAHDEKPRKRRGKKALATPFGPRASVHHPGTHGKHPWAKGVARSTPAARAIIVARTRGALKDALKL